MAHHGAGLLRETHNPERVRRLQADYRTADLSTADRAMLDYCQKLTREPSQICEADVAGLRAVDFSDAAILDICQVASYFNFVNRIADGLGVELEAYWDKS